jgi:hypothetical protein
MLLFKRTLMTFFPRRDVKKRRKKIDFQSLMFYSIATIEKRRVVDGLRSNIGLSVREMTLKSHEMPSRLFFFHFILIHYPFKFTINIFITAYCVVQRTHSKTILFFCFFFFVCARDIKMNYRWHTKINLYTLNLMDKMNREKKKRR